MSEVHISAVIITYNEERNIERCLKGLDGLVDEIVVLDSFSTDRTSEYCRRWGVRFEQHTFDGYGPQKRRAVDSAKYDIVLCLDADEVPDDTLRAAILQAKHHWTGPGYTMNRLSNYCGQWVRHSGWYPDRKLRLFDRRAAQWNDHLVHEAVEIPASTPAIVLAGNLLHYTYTTVEEHRARAKRYAALAAEGMRARGYRPALAKRWLSPLFRWIKHYLLQRGFLDGRAGWHIARIAMLENFWKYQQAYTTASAQADS